MLEFDGIYECYACRHLFADDPSWGLGVGLESYTVRENTLRPPVWGAEIHDFRTVSGVYPKVEVLIERYARGGIALELWNDEGLLLTATVWLPGLPQGRVAIKDHSENAGCLEQLVDHGIVDPPESFMDGLPICRLGGLLY